MKKSAQDIWDAMRPADREQFLNGNTDISKMIAGLEHIVSGDDPSASPHIAEPVPAVSSQEDWDRLSEAERERLLSGL